MTRNQHLQWAKDRALKQKNSILMYVSFNSDMSKHKKLKDHIALNLWKTININDVVEVIRFIKGFN